MAGDSRQIRLWYAGLEAVEPLPLEERDLTRLRRLMRSRRTVAGLTLLGGPAIVVSMLFVVVISARLLHRDLGDVISSVAAIAFLVGLTLALFLALPLGLLVGRDTWRQYRIATSALMRGTLLRCRGLTANLVVDRRTWKWLSGSGLLRAEVTEIDVLEDSGLLWRMNGIEVDRWVLLPHGTTTVTPEYATIASRWTRPTETASGTIDFNRRSLSEDELRELAHSVPRVGLVRLALVAVVNAYAIYRLVTFGSEERHVAETAIAIALAVWSDFELVRAWLLRSRFKSDLDEGWVAIVKLPNDPDHVEQPASFAEFLPESGVEWTTDGLPAVWRRVFLRR